MRNLAHLAFPLSLIIFATIGCGLVESPQSLESERADINRNPVKADSQLFLNNEPLGHTSDLDKKKSDFAMSDPRNLADRVHSILEIRKANGVFVAGSSDPADSIYLFLDPTLALGSVAKLHAALTNAGASVLLARSELPKDALPDGHPNPLFLGVSTEKLDPETTLPATLPEQDPDHRFTYNVAFQFATSPQALLSTRAFAGSIEISADERYFANMPQGEAADRGPEKTRVDQRPLDAGELSEATLSVRGTGTPGLHVIVSEKASYRSLLPILDAVEKDLAIYVVVRPAQF